MTNLQSYLHELNEVSLGIDLVQSEMAISRVWRSLSFGQNIFTAGNGGSAATALHYAVDWSKGFCQKTGNALSVQCINANVSVLSAIANDIDYQSVFSYQLQMWMKPGDLLVVVSGSGNSKNILSALEAVRSLGGQSIGVLGFDGGLAKSLCDFTFHIPTNNMQIFEDLSSVFGHVVLKNYQ